MFVLVVLHSSPPGQTDHWASEWDDGDTNAGDNYPNSKLKTQNLSKFSNRVACMPMKATPFGKSQCR